MELELILIGLAIFIMVGSIFFSVHYYREYKNMVISYNTLKKVMDKSYIKADTRVHNAVYEAYEQAVSKDNQFEAKIFSNLLQELKGKW